MERLTVRVKEGDRKNECFIPGNKNAIEKVGYIHEDGRWESEEYKGKAIDKLAEYEDLEEQNRLIKLPCVVGDTVYYLDRFCSGTSLDCPCRPCESCEDYKLEIYEGKFKLNDINDFEKTVFLTREAAEAALKELRDKKG